MFEELTFVGDALEGLIAEFEIDTLSGAQAARATIELGRIRKLTDALIARVAVRVDATAAHAKGNDKSADEFVARSTGVSKTEAKSLADTAHRLKDLPATRAKVATGEVSMRDAATIAGAVRVNPAAEQRLLGAAAQGSKALREAAIAARAEVEDDAKRARR